MNSLQGHNSTTPTDDSSLARRYADFATLTEALDYAAGGRRGINFFNGRGDLVAAESYAAIHQAAVGIGRRLITLGFEPGDRIALIATTNAAFVKFFLGCQYASVLPVPMPLPTSFGGKEGYISQLRGQIQSCQASGVMVPESMSVITARATEGLEMRLIGDFNAYQAVEPADKLHLPCANDLAYLQYSSGSTRFPHGVAVTHRSLLSNTHGIGRHGVRISDGDRCCSWLPFYHDMGLVGTFLSALCCQVSADFLPSEDFARRPLAWLQVISRYQGTITYSPTFGFDICARRASLKPSVLEGLDLSSIRVAGIGGDMIRPEVMRAFSSVFAPTGFNPKALLPSYGLAECTLGVSFAVPGTGIKVVEVEESCLTGDSHILINGAAADKRMREVVNCGTPLPEYEVEIRDSDHNPLQDGRIGRIFVRGVSVMKAYFNDPETTRAVLSEDGWLDTGDMGFRQERDLFIVGRVKDMIIVNGRNHWPQDIEWAVEQLPGVRNGGVAAISIPGDHGQEVPLLLVQCRKLEAAEEGERINSIKQHIQRETGIICQVKLVPPGSLPRTSSGKLSRSKARNKYLAGHL